MNPETRYQFNICSVNKKTEERKSGWRQNIMTMNEERLSNEIPKYKPSGRQELYKPKQRLAHHSGRAV
jgi:hypothetical protein